MACYMPGIWGIPDIDLRASKGVSTAAFGPVPTSAASIAVTQHSTPNLDGTAFRQPLAGCFHRRAAATHHSGRPAFRRASAYFAGCSECRYGPEHFRELWKSARRGQFKQSCSQSLRFLITPSKRTARSSNRQCRVFAQMTASSYWPAKKCPSATLTLKCLSRLKASVTAVGAEISQETPMPAPKAQSAICSNAVLASLRSGVSNPSVNQL
jgi:hypothetical protein